MTSKYVWQQTDDSSGYTEDKGRSAECLRWFTERGLCGCTVYENTLRTVQVASQQSTPTLEAGGNTLHSAGSPFLPDEP